MSKEPIYMPLFYPTKFKIGDIVVINPERINEKYYHTRKMTVISMHDYYIAPIIVVGEGDNDWHYEDNLILFSDLRKEKFKRLL